MFHHASINIRVDNSIFKRCFFHKYTNHFRFLVEDKLYVIMELVEGAPLGEHFNSLKEKGTRFSEERIWHIFIQVHQFRP